LNPEVGGRRGMRALEGVKWRKHDALTEILGWEKE